MSNLESSRDVHFNTKEYRETYYHVMEYVKNHDHVRLALKLKDFNPTLARQQQLKTLGEATVIYRNLTALDMWLKVNKEFPEVLYRIFGFAADHGYTESVDIFVEHGLDINYINDDGQTPLFIAISGDHDEFAKKLMGLGADINVLPPDPMPIFTEQALERMRNYVPNIDNSYEIDR